MVWGPVPGRDVLLSSGGSDRLSSPVLGDGARPPQVGLGPVRRRTRPPPSTQKNPSQDRLALDFRCPPCDNPHCCFRERTAYNRPLVAAAGRGHWAMALPSSRALASRVADSHAVSLKRRPPRRAVVVCPQHAPLPSKTRIKSKPRASPRSLPPQRHSPMRSYRQCRRTADKTHCIVCQAPWAGS